MSASRNKFIPLMLLAFLATPAGRAWGEAAETVSENKETDVIIPEPVQEIGGVSGARRDIGGVQSQELLPVSQETVGTLDEAHGGLSIDMWKGTPREVVETFLPQLASGPGARTPYDLQRRFLLTSAEVPQGLPGLGEKDTASLLIRRVERLYAMAAWDDARRMLALLPEKLRAESLIRYDVEALFLAHDDQQACERAKPHLGAGDDRFWTKAAVVCALIEEDKAHANMALDMMREEKIADPFFTAQAEAMLGMKIKKFPPLEDPGAIHLTLLRVAKKPLPDGMADKLTAPSLLKGIASWAEFNAESRMAAARKAEAAGAVSTDELRRLYDATDFSEKELSGDEKEIMKQKGERRAALLYRLAKRQDSVEARAERIAKNLGGAGSGNGLLAAMRLHAPLVEEIPPGSTMAWFAPSAVRILLAAGKEDKAKEWVPFAKPQGEVQNKAGEALLLPILRLMDAVPALEQAHLENWREAGKDMPSGRAALLFGLLEALGDPVPAQLWLTESSAKAEAANIPPAIWHGLKQAAENKSSGQAALYSLLALDAEGVGGASPIVLQEVVRTLKAGGLEKDARALALEAAIAAGI